MKLKYIIICLLPFLFSNCESDNSKEINPCLDNKNVNVTLNGNLPAFADLIQFAGNEMFIEDDINFIRGVYILNTNNDFYIALELAEPNDCEMICSIPDSFTEGQFEYTCGEETSFYRANGEKVGKSEGEFDMIAYAVRRSGNTLTISN